MNLSRKNAKNEKWQTAHKRPLFFEIQFGMGHAPRTHETRVVCHDDGQKKIVDAVLIRLTPTGRYKVH